MCDWMERGLAAYQALLPDGEFSSGSEPTLADICLISQLYSVHRWGLDLDAFTRLTSIEARCLSLSAFSDARPKAQPDAI